MTDEYLEHHGIKGMHWGVRKYQNADGSLTTAGKRRAAMDQKSQELFKKANKVEAKSKYGRLYSDWKKKNPNADEDDFGDYLQVNHPKVNPTKKWGELMGDSHKLSKDYVKKQAIGAAMSSSMMVAPVVGFVTYKKNEKWKSSSCRRIEFYWRTYNV